MFSPWSVAGPRCNSTRGFCCIFAATALIISLLQSSRLSSLRVPRTSSFPLVLTSSQRVHDLALTTSFVLLPCSHSSFSYCILSYYLLSHMRIIPYCINYHFARRCFPILGVVRNFVSTENNYLLGLYITASGTEGRHRTRVHGFFFYFRCLLFVVKLAVHFIAFHKKPGVAGTVGSSFRNDDQCKQDVGQFQFRTHSS